MIVCLHHPGGDAFTCDGKTNGGFYLNEADSTCSTYYQCSNGIAYQQTCAAGTLFSTAASTCAHAATVTCEVVSGKTISISSYITYAVYRNTVNTINMVLYPAPTYGDWSVWRACVDGDSCGSNKMIRTRTCTGSPCDQTEEMSTIGNLSPSLFLYSSHPPPTSADLLCTLLLQSAQRTLTTRT